MNWNHCPPPLPMAAGIFLAFMLSTTLLTAQSSATSSDWTDPETHLMWTTTDNGAGLSWSQAARYCRDLNTGGFQDWKLPAISDLQRLFGGPEDTRGYHVRGPIKLSGWQWSATPGERSGEAWALDFGDGARASVAAGDSGLNRALCVRNGDWEPGIKKLHNKTKCTHIQ